MRWNVPKVGDCGDSPSSPARFLGSSLHRIRLPSWALTSPDWKSRIFQSPCVLTAIVATARDLQAISAARKDESVISMWFLDGYIARKQVQFFA